MGKRRPLFIDLSSGCIGTYLDVIPAAEGQVRVKYRRLNQISGFIVTSRTYSIENIATVIGDKSEEGCVEEYKIVVEDSQGRRTFLDKIGEITIESVKRYKDEAKLKEYEVAQHKHRARKLREETKKQVAEDREITHRTPTERDPNSPFRFSPGFRGYMDDEY